MPIMIGRHPGPRGLSAAQGVGIAAGHDLPQGTISTRFDVLKVEFIAQSRSFLPSMRFFRRLIALLLMVTLPAYAWAAVGVSEFCPMQSVSMIEMADADHPCCDPADGGQGQPDGQNPCKPGQECKTGSLYQPAFPRAAQPVVAAAVVVSAVESLLLSRDPTGVWRPPRPL